MNGYSNLFGLSSPAIFSTANVWPDVLQMVQLAKSNTSFVANIVGFASTKGYQFQALDVPASLSTIIQEINKGYPLILITNGNDPIPFHSEAVFGYDVRQDGVYIAYYDNWNEGEGTIWKKFNASQIYDLITIEPVVDIDCPPVSTPEPLPLYLLGIGLLAISLILRKRRQK